MRRYSILQALPLSFFSRDLYRDVARSWRGIGLAYLALVVGLLTLVVGLRMQAGLHRWARGEAQEFADQVPAIEIHHRVVRVEAAMPYVITDRRTGMELAIVDTTGTITSLDGLEARALLTAGQIMFRKSAAETRVFDLARVERFTIDRTLARRWLGLFDTWALPILAPFVFLGLFLVRFVQQFMLAVIGFAVGRPARAGIDFSAAMRLGAVAMTPVLVLEPVLELARARPPAWGWLWMAIACATVVWAVLANRSGPADAAAAPPPGAPPVGG